MNLSCWLNGYYQIFAFAIPCFIIVILNIWIFYMIFKNLIETIRKRREYTNIRSENDIKSMKKEFMFIASCFVTTQLTWLVGIAVILPSLQWLHYLAAFLFCGLNATQGVHIFIVYIVISKERRSRVTEKLKYGIENIKMNLQRR